MSETWKRGCTFGSEYGMEKFPLCSGHVLEDMISVSSREKVEKTYMQL